MAMSKNRFVVFRSRAFSSLRNDEVVKLLMTPITADPDIVVVSLKDLANQNSVLSLPYETRDHFETSMAGAAGSAQFVRRYHLATGLAMLENVLVNPPISLYAVADIAGLILAAAAKYPSDALGLSSVLLSRVSDCDEPSDSDALAATAKIIEAMIERVPSESDAAVAIAVAELFLRSHEKHLMPAGVGLWNIAIETMRGIQTV